MFAGELSRGAYARAAAIRIVAFVALTVALPLALNAILSATDCARNTGACGAIALVVYFFLKPIIYLLFVLSFIRITVRRFRDLRLPAAIAIILPLLMLGDVMFGITMGAHWGVGFVLGAGPQWPRYLFAALVCIAFLCLVPADPTGEERAGRWGVAGAIALGILVLMCVGAALKVAENIGPGWRAPTASSSSRRCGASTASTERRQS